MSINNFKLHRAVNDSDASPERDRYLEAQYDLAHHMMSMVRLGESYWKSEALLDVAKTMAQNCEEARKAWLASVLGDDYNKESDI